MSYAKGTSDIKIILLVLLLFMVSSSVFGFVPPDLNNQDTEYYVLSIESGNVFIDSRIIIDQQTIRDIFDGIEEVKNRYEPQDTTYGLHDAINRYLNSQIQLLEQNDIYIIDNLQQREALFELFANNEPDSFESNILDNLQESGELVSLFKEYGVDIPSSDLPAIIFSPPLEVPDAW